MIKEIKNTYGKYFISDSGVVMNNSNKILKNQTMHKGYYYVNLYLNNKYISKRIHRLVADAFIPNPHKKPQVNHIDGNKKNNDKSNLEWVTNKENARHAFDIGLRKSPMKGKKGILCKLSKPVQCFNKNGFLISEYDSCMSAYRESGIGHIAEVCNGKRKTAGGFVWKWKKQEETI